MKKLLVLLFVLLIINIAYAQGCLPSGITFSTQQQIDNFQANYPGCTDIEGNVIISGNDISNLDGLNVLVSIEGNLEIRLNELLDELSGLQNLEYLGGNLRIEQNKVLVNLQGFENLTNLNGDLIIGDIVWGQFPYSTGNPLLTSLNGLNNLVAIDGNLKLCGNYSLTTLSGLDNLAIISGNFQVGGIEFVYGFTFGNPLLINLSGLSNLSAIGGGLFVAGNSNLANFSGLDSLTTIGQHCWFDLNESLLTMQGLNQLASIGGSLFIRWNSALTNISGLQNIAAQSIQDIEIIYNEALAECSIQSICHYLASPTGTVDIYSNAPGCNNQEEVEAACEAVGVGNTVFVKGYSLFPNPANQLVTFTCNNSSTILELNISNQTGQKVYCGKPDNNTLDISKLQPGMYLVEVITKEGKEIKKLIIK